MNIYTPGESGISPVRGHHGARRAFINKRLARTMPPMSLVFAAVMPHGGALIPGVDDGSEHVSPSLTEAMRRVGAAAHEARLDSLLIFNPHGIGVADAHSITMSPRMDGDLGPHSLSIPVDIELAETILAGAEADGFPVCGIVNSNGNMPLPLDWGAFVPAWFLSEASALPPTVVICPSRDTPFTDIARLGERICEMLEASDKRIGVIASADNAHAHQGQGPYGFHPAAKVFDALIVELTKEGRFEEYLTLDHELMEQALPDSPWQLSFLTGISRKTPFTVTEVTYDCPSYFGMMVALFARSS